MNTIFNKISKRQKQTPTSKKNTRKLSLEVLEDRTLLAVSVAEFDQIRDIYPELNLSANINDYNLIEITRNQLSTESLQAAINTAAQTTHDDLIVVHNNGEKIIDLGTETLKIDIDSDLFGNLTIISLGAGALQIQSSANTGVIQVVRGDVALGGVVLCGIENAEMEVVSVFDLIQTDTSAVVQTSNIVRITENTNQPGNFTIAADANTTTQFSTSGGSSIGTKSYSITFGVGGTLEAYLTGLSEADKNSIIAGSMNFLSKLTPYDAEKNNKGDSQLCWAATSSNMLAYTGWGDVNGFLTEDDILSYFKTYFTDAGSRSEYGNEWFISGRYAPSLPGFGGVGTWAKPKFSNGGQFYPTVNYSAIAGTANIAGASSITSAVNRLKGGSAVGLSLGWYNSSHARNEGHAITMWGAVYDKAKSSLANDYYVSLLVTDSDDNKPSGINAPNLLKSLSIQYVGAFNQYRFNSYSNGTGYLEGFNWLAARPEIRSTVVTTLSDVVNANDGKISLREAITYAGSNGLGTTVTFASSLQGQTIRLNGSTLTINKNLTIDGGTRNITISAEKKSNVFQINSERTVSLSGLTITNGVGSGIIHHYGSLTISYCTVTGNTANKYGGGIDSGVSSNLTIRNSTISNNSAPEGGGVYFSGRVLTITNSTISNNKASNGWGGGIYCSSSLTITNSSISNNSASVTGGGIVYTGSSSNNYMRISNSTVTHNTAISGYGGGIHFNGYGESTVMNSTISNNSAHQCGGGISRSGNVGFITISDSTISGNIASNRGGGIFTQDNENGTVSLTVVRSTVAGNKASQGGGVAIYNREIDEGKNIPRASFQNTIIAGNYASGGGGGIWSYGIMSLSNVTIAGNRASIGAGLYNFDGTTTIQNSIIAKNTTSVNVDNLWTYSDNYTFTDVSYSLIDNTSLPNGGKTFRNLGNNILNVDPLFVSYTPYVTWNANLWQSWNLRLKTNSPAIKAGRKIGFGLEGPIPVDMGNYVVPPGVPENFEIAALTANSVTLSWAETHADLTGYELLYKRAGDSNWEAWALAPEVTDTSMTIAGLVANTEYDFKLTAINESGSASSTIGARTFESPSIIVTTLNDVNDAHDGMTSLREALAYAQSGETITFDILLNDKTITLDGTELYIDKNITIDATKSYITINADRKSRVFNIAPDSEVVLAGLSIINGKAIDPSNPNGGGIYNQGLLTLNNSMLFENSAEWYGGGILNANILVVENCLFFGNTAKDGGGIENWGAFTLTNSILAENAALGYGGGIENCNGVSYLTNCTVSRNTDRQGGGGVYNINGAINLNNTIVTGNSLGDICSYYDYDNDEGVVQGNNNLSTFNSWSGNSANNYFYDPTLPLFVDADNGDYRLAMASQAINKGNNDDLSDGLVFDFDGNERIVDGIVDIGAYEYQGNIILPTLDLDGDGVVNDRDANLLLLYVNGKYLGNPQWANSLLRFSRGERNTSDAVLDYMNEYAENSKIFDLDGDGIVNDRDANLLLLYVNGKHLGNPQWANSLLRFSRGERNTGEMVLDYIENLLPAPNTMASPLMTSASMSLNTSFANLDEMSVIAEINLRERQKKIESTEQDSLLHVGSDDVSNVFADYENWIDEDKDDIPKWDDDLVIDVSSMDALDLVLSGNLPSVHDLL